METIMMDIDDKIDLMEHNIEYVKQLVGEVIFRMMGPPQPDTKLYKKLTETLFPPLKKEYIKARDPDIPNFRTKYSPQLESTITPNVY